MTLTSEELLAGSAIHHEVEIPSRLVEQGQDDSPKVVQAKALTVRDLQLIAKAAKDDENLSAALMIQQALVEPRLTLEQIQRLPAGLARHLVDQINAISGIELPRDALEEMVQAPLAKACFVLGKEFGWTPEEVSGMTIGQILLFLEMGRKEAQTA